MLKILQLILPFVYTVIRSLLGHTKVGVMDEKCQEKDPDRSVLRHLGSVRNNSEDHLGPPLHELDEEETVSNST